MTPIPSPPQISRNDVLQCIRTAATLEQVVDLVNAHLGGARQAWGDTLEDAQAMAYVWQQMHPLLFDAKHPEALQETLYLTKLMAAVILHPSDEVPGSQTFCPSAWYRVMQFAFPVQQEWIDSEVEEEHFLTLARLNPKAGRRALRHLNEDLNSQYFRRCNQWGARVQRQLGLDLSLTWSAVYPIAAQALPSWESIDQCMGGGLENEGKAAVKWDSSGTQEARWHELYEQAASDDRSVARLRGMQVPFVRVGVVGGLTQGYRSLSLLADAYEALAAHLAIPVQTVGLNCGIIANRSHHTALSDRSIAAFHFGKERDGPHLSFGALPRAVGHEWVHAYDHVTRNTAANRAMHHTIRTTPCDRSVWSNILCELHAMVDAWVLELLTPFWQDKGRTRAQSSTVPTELLKQTLALTHAPKETNADLGFVHLLYRWKDPTCPLNEAAAVSCMNEMRRWRADIHALNRSASGAYASAFTTSGSLADGLYRREKTSIRVRRSGRPYQRMDAYDRSTEPSDEASAIRPQGGAYYAHTTELLARAGEQWLSTIDHPSFALPSERSALRALLTFPQGSERVFLEQHLASWMAALRATPMDTAAVDPPVESSAAPRRLGRP